MAEPLRENVLGDPEVKLEIREATNPEERVPDDEKSPPIPEDLEGLGHRAVLVVKAPAHPNLVASRDQIVQTVRHGGAWRVEADGVHPVRMQLRSRGRARRRRRAKAGAFSG